MFNFRTKKLGIILKTVVLVFLPLPLILWPVVGIVGSLLGGIGYGFFVPLIATFEAVGAGVTDKLYHCLAVSSFFCFRIMVKVSFFLRYVKNSPLKMNEKRKAIEIFT